MLRRTLIVLSLVALSVAAVALPGAASAKSGSPHYYLSLGDSLAQGMQPDLKGALRNTDQGYPNALLTTERANVHNLQLVQFGCGGESTTSMLTGQGNNASARTLHCNRAGGSQQAAAVRFLRAHHHRGAVPLITVDIGANDVDACGRLPAGQVAACAISGLGTINQNLPKILAGLRKAAPRGTTFAAMTLYDPFLAGYLAPAGSTNRTVATESVGLAQVINGDLTKADGNAGFLTADVAGAFGTYDGTDMVAWEDQSIPLNVSRLCSWTWACATPPSGPNIHPNKNGYQVIANALATAIGNRLR